jgi:hypothetical protein
MSLAAGAEAERVALGIALGRRRHYRQVVAIDQSIEGRCTVDVDPPAAATRQRPSEPGP